MSLSWRELNNITNHKALGPNSTKVKKLINFVLCIKMASNVIEGFDPIMCIDVSLDGCEVCLVFCSHVVPCGNSGYIQKPILF